MIGFPFQLFYWHNQWPCLYKAFEIPDQRYFFTWSCMDNNLLQEEKLNFQAILTASF